MGVQGTETRYGKRKAALDLEKSKRFRLCAYAAGGTEKENVAIAAKVAKIVAAIEDPAHDSATSVPASVRGMLAAGARGALSAPATNRHQFQETVCFQIRVLLDEVAASIRGRGDAERSAFAVRKGDVVRAEQDVAAQEEAVVNAAAAAKARVETYAACQQATAYVEQGLLTVRKSLTDHAKERDGIVAECRSYTDIMDGNLKLLMDGDWTEENDARAAVEKLMKDMKEVGAEAALLSSAPPVLMKKPAERKGFDGIVLETLLAYLTEKVKAANARLEACAGAGAVIEAQVTAKEKDLANSNEACEAAAGEVARAKSHQEECAATLREAKTVAATCKVAADTHLQNASKVDAEGEAVASIRLIFDELIARAPAIGESVQTKIEAKADGLAGGVEDEEEEEEGGAVGGA